MANGKGSTGNVVAALASFFIPGLGQLIQGRLFAALFYGFLAMAIGAGMTSAITNPLEPEIMRAIMAADVLTGHDRDCAAWIRANREQGDDTRAEGRRRTNRRRALAQEARTD